MITVYKVDRAAFQVVPVLCEVFGYPNKDADGNIMYDNSHYLNEAEAQEQLLIEATAWRELAARRVGDAELALFDAQQDLSAAVAMYGRIHQRVKR